MPFTCRPKKKKNKFDPDHVIATYYNKTDKHKIYNLLVKDKRNTLENLDDTINHLKTKIVIEEKRLKDLEMSGKNKTECSICMNNIKNTVVIPCGHTYCNECIGNQDTCFICREKITNKYNIYI